MCYSMPFEGCTAYCYTLWLFIQEGADTIKQTGGFQAVWQAPRQEIKQQSGICAAIWTQDDVSRVWEKLAENNGKMANMFTLSSLRRGVEQVRWIWQLGYQVPKLKDIFWTHKMSICYWCTKIYIYWYLNLVEIMIIIITPNMHNKNVLMTQCSNADKIDAY